MKFKSILIIYKLVFHCLEEYPSISVSVDYICIESSRDHITTIGNARISFSRARKT